MSTSENTLLKSENTLLKNKHILVCIIEQVVNLDDTSIKEIAYIKSNFCGTTILNVQDLIELNSESIIIYMCGDIETNYNILANKEQNKIRMIKELSYNYDNLPQIQSVTTGQVPINVHNVGIYFRNFFDADKNYFDLISTEHNFQLLKHSSKPGEAFRKGIYLTHVAKTDDGTEFNLLRCSTNLNGPTDNFRTTDLAIMEEVNNIGNDFFSEKPNFNHVLAQIYENKTLVSGGKTFEKKATIKAHSDKTKDMPSNALMAFATFYSNGELSTHKQIKKSPLDQYDYIYNNRTSVLTKMRFELKSMVTDPTLIKDFTITLYPNSLFIIPLSTNRLYTHEIRPSSLPVSTIPTRLGYVIRCSKTKAIFKDNQVFIKENENNIPLKPLDKEDSDKLTELYFRENTTDQVINYDNFYSSMNDGDYLEPLV